MHSILAVDDSASMRQMVSFTLKSAGYKSEHPGYGTTVSVGMNQVRQIVDAVLGSAYSETTLVLVAWDEPGHQVHSRRRRSHVRPAAGGHRQAARRDGWPFEYGRHERAIAGERRGGRRKFQVPILLQLQLARAEHRRVRRRQFQDAVERRERIRHPLKREILVQRQRAEPPREIGQLEGRLANRFSYGKNDGTPDRCLVSWVVRGSAGDAVTVQVANERAGSCSVSITL